MTSKPLKTIMDYLVNSLMGSLIVIAESYRINQTVYWRMAVVSG